MNLEEFKVGEIFYASAGFAWRCTDKGSRTINAIMLDPDKKEYWFVGPPYSVQEIVFDEHDMLDCHKTVNDKLQEGEEDSIYHPGIINEDAMKMMEERMASRCFHKTNLMKRDRVDKDGGILHGYAAVLKDNVWYVKTYELFSRVFAQMPENDFVRLAVSSQEDIKKRKESYDNR